MEETKETQASKQPKQLSYEDLRNIAGQLQQQNVQLRMALDENNYSNMFKRLDYLFKVLEFAHMFDDKFVSKCASEIESLITVPEETQVKEEDQNPKEE